MGEDNTGIEKLKADLALAEKGINSPAIKSNEVLARSLSKRIELLKAQIAEGEKKLDDFLADYDILQEVCYQLKKRFGKNDVYWLLKDKQIIHFICDDDEKQGLYSLKTQRVIFEPERLSADFKDETEGVISFMRYNHQPKEYIDYDGKQIIY